ncbi:hypothetical protein [Parafilimonas sp.]
MSKPPFKLLLLKKSTLSRLTDEQLLKFKGGGGNANVEQLLSIGHS